MSRIFISYSHKDRNFVDFLTSKLDQHKIGYWRYEMHGEKGKIIDEDIEKNLDDSDNMVVVVSSHINSPWITEEITYFKTRKKGAKIIPLLLDDVNPSTITHDLGRYQGIDCLIGWSTGIEQLIKELENIKEKELDRRTRSERRKEERRKAKEDMRSKNVNQYIRDNLWDCYSFKNNIDENDNVPASAKEISSIINSLKRDINNYAYKDKNSKEILETEESIAIFESSLWSQFKDRKLVNASFLFEVLAEEIEDKYIIEPIERRQSDNRRRNATRRADDRRRLFNQLANDDRNHYIV